MERAAWIILFIAVLIALESREPKPEPQPPLTAEACAELGLFKLTEGEQAALGQWVGQSIHCSPDGTPPLPPLPPKPKGEVMFNTHSRKYHCLSCRSVAGCKNCILLSRREAKERGGIACGNCGGCD